MYLGEYISIFMKAFLIFFFFFKSSDSETSFTQKNVASLFQNGNGMDVPEAEETVTRKQRKRTK